MITISKHFTPLLSGFYLRKYGNLIKNTLRRGSKVERNVSNNFLIAGATKSLTLQSRIELEEMIHHPMFAVVFQIEYVLNIPVVQPELPTDKKARSRVIV